MSGCPLCACVCVWVCLCACALRLLTVFRILWRVTAVCHILAVTNREQVTAPTLSLIWHNLPQLHKCTWSHSALFTCIHYDIVMRQNVDVVYHDDGIITYCMRGIPFTFDYNAVHYFINWINLPLQIFTETPVTQADRYDYVYFDKMDMVGVEQPVLCCVVQMMLSTGTRVSWESCRI